MADIDVVRKRSSVWPWVIGLLVLAVILWAVFGMMSERPATEPSPASSVEQPAGAVHATHSVRALAGV